MSPLRFIHALRPINLLMTVFIMVSVKYGLFTEYAFSIGGQNQHVPYFVYIFSVLCVMSFGYLINDYYDIETDKINKPGKNIFVTAHPQNVWMLAFLCLLLGIIPVGLLWKTGKGSFFFPLLLNLSTLFMLYKYAKSGKGTVLFGNLLIALLGALLLWASFFAAGNILLHFEQYRKLVLDYSVFAFLATLLREIVKDAEDVDGDTRSGIRTLATRYGTRASRYVGYFVNIVLILALTYIAHNEYQIQQYNRAIGFGILAVYGIFTLFILWNSRDKAGFRRTSLALKIYMALGIMSMWL